MRGNLVGKEKTAENDAIERFEFQGMEKLVAVKGGGGENFRDIDRRISKGEKVAVLRSADRGCIDHQGWPTAGTGRRNYVSSMQTLRPERGNRL